MHFCADELVAIVAAIPFARAAVMKLIWWRARRAKDEVRECRSCKTEITKEGQ